MFRKKNIKLVSPRKSFFESQNENLFWTKTENKLRAAPSGGYHAQKHTELYCYVCIVNELYQFRIIQLIRLHSLATTLSLTSLLSVCSPHFLTTFSTFGARYTRYLTIVKYTEFVKRGIFSTHQKLNQTLFIHCALTH